MTATGGSWAVERMIGTAADLHRAGSDLTHRVVRVNEVTRPAVVLSSTQSADVLDVRAVDLSGADVVRRSSGGGLVQLGVGQQLWVDIFLPRDDPLWVDDVSHSADWLGASWVRALETIGVHGGEVTDGAWSDPDLGRLVCFAATGPGEVTVTGRKIVGISQRRTRAGARFQCTVYNTFSVDMVMSLIDASVVGRELYTRLFDGLGSGVGSLDQLGPRARQGSTDDVSTDGISSDGVTSSDATSAEGADHMENLLSALVRSLP